MAEQIWGVKESLKLCDKSSQWEQVPPLPISDSLKLSQGAKTQGQKGVSRVWTHLVWRLESSLELQFLKTLFRLGKSQLLLKGEQDGSRCWGSLQQEKIIAGDFGICLEPECCVTSELPVCPW